LLSKIVFTIRDAPTYTVSNASRWIRCVVQLILDQHGLGKKAVTSKTMVDPSQKLAFQTVKAITEQALVLAKSIKPGANVDVRDLTYVYPMEEIEWLASTLFNLSIDILYCNKDVKQTTKAVAKEVGDESRSGLPSTSVTTDTRSQICLSGVSATNTESGAAPDANAAGTALTGVPSHDTNPGQENDNPKASDKEDGDEGAVTCPQMWASLALQLADLLDTNLGLGKEESRVPVRRCPATATTRASVESFTDSRVRTGNSTSTMTFRYGDGGALARGIRERCRMLGWDL